MDADKISHKGAKVKTVTANARENGTGEPQMDQPSREAMAGKTSASSVESLQIYADRDFVERCLASSDVRLSRTMEDKCEPT